MTKPLTRRRGRRNAQRGLDADNIAISVVKADVAWRMAEKAHPKLSPYLHIALDWRQELLRAASAQYGSLGAIACALIANAACAYALAMAELAANMPAKARGHLGEVRSSLFAAWTVANKESGRTLKQSEGLDHLMRQWEEGEAAKSKKHANSSGGKKRAITVGDQPTSPTSTYPVPPFEGGRGVLGRGPKEETNDSEDLGVSEKSVHLNANDPGKSNEDVEIEEKANANREKNEAYVRKLESRLP